ncbi:hypothetical protein VTJ04DRAFT_4836 [Mycothermus thermophilus]|uniref:uncharacterized protein n=1 Tax=Humicola insolens TaxID=85995 RepID=UPI003743F164
MVACLTPSHSEPRNPSDGQTTCNISWHASSWGKNAASTQMQPQGSAWEQTNPGPTAGTPVLPHPPLSSQSSTHFLPLGTSLPSSSSRMNSRDHSSFAA